MKIRKSKIHGSGVFADKKINKGEHFYKISMNKTSNSPKSHWARVGNKWVCDEKVLNFVNHSCEANTQISLDGTSLVALWDVEPGEEITCDYEATEIDGVQIKCNCGKSSCRGYFLREE